MTTKSNSEPLSDYDRSLGFLIHDVARLMRYDFERRVRSSGLTRAQWFVLAHLIRTDGQTQTQLGDETDMEKAALGKLLDRLEEGGWIERRAHPRDKRANYVFRTAKVEPLIERMAETSNVLYRDALAGLSKQDSERLIDALQQIKGNLLRVRDESR